MKARHEFKYTDDYEEYLRTYFAAMAMQGLFASWGNHDVTDFSEIASDAVTAADKLIKALNDD